jgi:hypothetical protein
MGMQAPAQSLLAAGQAPPQEAPSQLTVPPVGTGHGAHEAPQEAGSMLLAHELPQT